MKNSEILVSVSVNIEDMVENLTDAQAMTLIKAADAARQDWDFTLSVAKFFVEDLMKELETKEEKLEIKRMFREFLAQL